MSSTTTITISPPASPKASPQFFILESKQAKDLLNKLATILENNYTSCDLLSGQLFKWGSRVVKLTNTCKDLEIGELNKLARKELDYLQNELLVDAITKKPLEKPVLDGDWTWDEKIIEICKESCNLSPLSGKSFNNIKVHDFALKMIDWLNHVQREEIIKNKESKTELSCFILDSTQDFISTVANNTIPLGFRSLLWHKAAENIRVKAENNKWQESASKESQESKKIFQQMKKDNAKVIENLRLEQAEKQKEINERIEKIAKLNKKRVDALQRRLDRSTQRVRLGDQRRDLFEQDLKERDEEIERLKESDKKNCEEVKRVHAKLNNYQDEKCIIV